MPANLTPDYLAAEARYRMAGSTEEKLTALDEMYATIPKHKGTEKMRADIKRRISKLRGKETESGKKGKRADDFQIVKQGYGQIVLLGLSNSGKSTLLNRLTTAESEMGDHPYTTKTPVAGMMECEGIALQLVDTPPISDDCGDSPLIGLVRNSDVIALVIDCSEDILLDHIEEVRAELSKSRVVLAGENAPEQEYYCASLSKTTFIIANKIDISGAKENLDVLIGAYGDEFVILPVSAWTGEGLEELRRRLIDCARINVL